MRLQHRLAQAGRSAAAAHRALAPAVAEAAREVEAMAARLARLQQALAEVEEAVERQAAAQQAAAQQAARGEAAGRATPDDATRSGGEAVRSGEGDAGSSWSPGGVGGSAEFAPAPASSPAADASA